MSRKSYEGGRRINDRSPGDGVKVGGSIYNGIILLPLPSKRRERRVMVSELSKVSTRKLKFLFSKLKSIDGF